MKLLDWINLHDCGVTPTAIPLADGRIEIRVMCVNSKEGTEHVESTFVRTYSEARAALGY